MIKKAKEFGIFLGNRHLYFFIANFYIILAAGFIQLNTVDFKETRFFEKVEPQKLEFGLQKARKYSPYILGGVAGTLILMAPFLVIKETD